MARMIRKQVYLDDRQELILKQMAALTGRTESQLIRDAIDLKFDPDSARSRRIRAALDAIAVGERMADAVDPKAGSAWPGRDVLYDPPRGMPKK